MKTLSFKNLKQPFRTLQLKSLASIFLLFLTSCLQPSQATPSTEAYSGRIRMMTANISSGNHQRYEQEGIRIFQGLKPDVVMIQEFNYRPAKIEEQAPPNTQLQDTQPEENQPQNSEALVDTSIPQFVSEAFGKDFHYFRENITATGAIPNGIISRYPILAAGSWEDVDMPNREFAWAQIDVPGSIDLWAISVHLHSKNTTYRAREAATLVEQMKKIPNGSYIILGGDFNIITRTDSIIKTFSAIVSEDAAPLDSNQRTQTNRNGKKNFDWLLTNELLKKLMIPVDFRTAATESPQEGLNLFSTGLVFNSSIFRLLNLVPPVQENDSIAEGMQHFPVIKDFAIPETEMVLQ